MKINVMKIGATINANNGSILTDEINVVTKMLSDCGHDVHYHTTRTRNMIPLPHATFHDLKRFDDCIISFEKLHILSFPQGIFPRRHGRFPPVQLHAQCFLL